MPFSITHVPLSWRCIVCGDQRVDFGNWKYPRGHVLEWWGVGGVGAAGKVTEPHLFAFAASDGKKEEKKSQHKSKNKKLVNVSSEFCDPLFFSFF